MITLILAIFLSIGSVATSGGVITGIPIGVGVAIILVNVVAILAILLLPAAVSDLRRRRGHPLQRVVLVMAAAVAILTLPFLAYWNLIGLHI